jgi:hypothetical protein
MKESAATFPSLDRAIARKEPPPGPAWLRTREGRRYVWELGLIIVIKLVLLGVLWLAFILPWEGRTVSPGAVVQQPHPTASSAAPHD